LSRYIGAATGATTSPTSSALAHDLIRKAGVDLVHGHSSHHSKAIEVYRGKLILYGCGDLINDDEGIGGYEKFRFRHDLTLMYFARIRTGDGKLQGLDIVTVRIRAMRLERGSNNDAAWRAEMLNREAVTPDMHVEFAPDATLRLTWT